MNNFCDFGDFELIFFLMTLELKRKKMLVSLFLYMLYLLCKKKKSSYFSLVNKNLVDGK